MPKLLFLFKYFMKNLPFKFVHILTEDLLLLFQAALALFGMVGGPQLGLYMLGILYPCTNTKVTQQNTELCMTKIQKSNYKTVAKYYFWIIVFLLYNCLCWLPLITAWLLLTAFLFYLIAFRFRHSGCISIEPGLRSGWTWLRSSCLRLRSGCTIR